MFAELELDEVGATACLEASQLAESYWPSQLPCASG
jgi:hypothetical protein